MRHKDEIQISRLGIAFAVLLIVVTVVIEVVR